MNAVSYLVEVIGSLLVMACVLRAYMYWLGIVTRDPIGQFVIAITDWLVKPLRKIMPAVRRIDWASILAGLLFAVVVATAVALFYGYASSFGWIVISAVAFLFDSAVFLLIVMVIAGAVLSWVNPHAPIAPTVNALTHPFLAPIRKIVPLIGGVDLSPLVLLIGVMFVSQLIKPYTPSYLFRALGFA